MRSFPLVLALLVGMSQSVAFAQTGDGGSNKAAAEALFTEGRKLMDAGRHSQACPKFEASQRLDPAVGTLLNLAECFEKTGRTASAWAEFREAASAARAGGSPEREQLARQRAEALEPRLSRLTISLSAGAAQLQGVRVQRNGVAVDPGELGSPIPVDPGRHVVEAAAPGHAPWTQTVDVAGEGASINVEIPELTTAPGAAGGSADGAAASSASIQADARNPPESSGGTQRTLGFIVGGVGVAGLAVGTVFGLRTGSTWDDAKAECADFPYECSDKGLDLKDDASSYGTISTVAFIAGSACVAAGAVLWLTADSDAGAAPQVGVGPGSLVVKGQF